MKVISVILHFLVLSCITISLHRLNNYTRAQIYMFQKWPICGKNIVNTIFKENNEFGFLKFIHNK
jgi:hypothetical protein